MKKQIFETEEQIQQKSDALAKLIANTIRLHNHTFLLQSENWKFMLTPAPNVPLTNTDRVSSINLIYRLYEDPNRNRIIVRWIYVYLGITVDEQEFEQLCKQGCFLTCYYPNEMIPVSKPHFLGEIVQYQPITKQVETAIKGLDGI